MGDPNVGEELRQFFLYLLSDGEALTAYYDRDRRDGVIARRGFKTGAGDLLREGSLRDIEEHILAVTGSQARPLLIVWPPM